MGIIVGTAAIPKATARIRAATATITVSITVGIRVATAGIKAVKTAWRDSRAWFIKSFHNQVKRLISNAEKLMELK